MITKKINHHKSTSVPIQFQYQNNYSLEDRYKEAKEVLQKYPERVPIICERSPIFSNDCPLIDKNKYLVPTNLSICQFLYVIRKRMKLNSEKALFLFINGNSVGLTKKIGDVYNIYKSEDLFLYTNYSLENTFGAL